MKSLEYLLAAAVAATLPNLAYAQADPQQDQQLSAFRTVTYGLEADNHCQLFDYVQRETIAYVKSTMLSTLRSRYNPQGLEAEEARIVGLAAEHWDGCLPRQVSDKWQLAEQAALYGNSVLAAGGNIPERVLPCAISSEGPSLTHPELLAIREGVVAHYADRADRPTFEAMSTSISQGMTAQCEANGFSQDLKPVYTWKTQKVLAEKTAAGEETSITEFGPWTSYRYFPFQGFNEFLVSAYRTPTGGTGRIVSVSLATESALGASGKLYGRDDGTLSIELSGSADAIEFRAAGMEPVRFQKTGGTGGNNFLAEGSFSLDEAATRALLELPEETKLAIYYQPGGRDTWIQFQNYSDQDAVLPVGRLKAAIDWASAPVPE